MDKILALLKEGLGASDELAAGLKNELELYAKSLKERYEAEYQKKVERAKQVCVEEVNKEKTRLSKSVKTFLESKAAAIEQAVARQRAIEESESAARLKKAKAILEGVELTDKGATSQDLQDAQKKITRLEKALNSLREERNLAVQKANTANDIAAKALQRTRQLEDKVAAAKPIAEGYCQEHKLPFPKDGKCAKCPGGEKKMDEGKKPAPARLDESRTKSAEPKSTRRTISESHNAAAPVAQPGTEISKIADTIE